MYIQSVTALMTIYLGNGELLFFLEIFSRPSTSVKLIVKEMSSFLLFESLLIFRNHKLCILDSELLSATKEWLW